MINYPTYSFLWKYFTLSYFRTFSKLVKRENDSENDKILSKFYTELYCMKKRVLFLFLISILLSIIYYKFRECANKIK